MTTSAPPPPIYLSPATIKSLDATLFVSVCKPHLFHAQLLPPRRLALLFGQPGDEKQDAIVELMQRDRGINVLVTKVTPDNVHEFDKVIQATVAEHCNSISGPVVLLIDAFEQLVMAQAHPGIRRYFGQLQDELLSQLPLHYGVLCVSNVPPNRAATQDHVATLMWQQFPSDCSVLFDLPNQETYEARLRHNVNALMEHCQGIPELVQVHCDFDDDTYRHLSLCARNHTMGDVDAFCQRLGYKIIQCAAETPSVQVDNDFIAPLLHGQGTRLAPHDVDRNQWPYDQAAGREHPVFKQPVEPQHNKRPRTEEEEEEVFEELGIKPV